MTECPCCEIPPKEKALYEAVLALLEEGVSISGLKVSDIARKAGIGKGTTYEYFKSKEELIIKALFYGTGEYRRELICRLRQTTGFRDTFMTILDWFDERMKEKNVLYQLITLDEMEGEMPQELHRFMKEKVNIVSKVREGITKISRIAMEEGLIPKTAPIALVNMMLVNNIISYVIYMKYQGRMIDIKKDEIREFLYNSIIRSFRE